MLLITFMGPVAVCTLRLMLPRSLRIWYMGTVMTVMDLLMLSIVFTMLFMVTDSVPHIRRDGIQIVRNDGHITGDDIHFVGNVFQ